jgi:predicted oxidoreductase
MIDLINSCLKQNYYLWSRDIYGAYTTEAAFGNAFGETMKRRHSTDFRNTAYSYLQAWSTKIPPLQLFSAYLVSRTIIKI